MPKSTYAHVPARFSQLTRYTVKCRNCHEECTYYERQIDADEPVVCRGCKHHNFPFVFHKVHLACDGCGRRLSDPVVREGIRILYFHPECAAVYDSVLALFQEQSLKLALNAVKFGAAIPPTKPAPMADYKTVRGATVNCTPRGTPKTGVASAPVLSVDILGNGYRAIANVKNCQ